MLNNFDCHMSYGSEVSITWYMNISQNAELTTSIYCFYQNWRQIFATHFKASIDLYWGIVQLERFSRRRKARGDWTLSYVRNQCRLLVRQLTYSCSGDNNLVSIHFWWRKTMLKDENSIILWGVVGWYSKFCFNWRKKLISTRLVQVMTFGDIRSAVCTKKV